MKKAVLFFFLVLSVPCFFAQDTIFKINGDTIICKVTRVEATTVSYSYKDFIYSEKHNLIGYISYSNGNRDDFNINRLENYKGSKGLLKDHQKNVITVNCLPLFLMQVNLAYERIMNAGNAGLKVSFLYSFWESTPTQYQPDPRERLLFNAKYTGNKIVSTDLEMNFYPIGQVKHCPYAGLTGIAGAFYYYDIPPNPSGSSVYDHNYMKEAGIRYTGMQYAMVIHGGYRCNYNENFLLGAKIGFGCRKEYTIFYDYLSPKMQVQVYMGVKF